MHFRRITHRARAFIDVGEPIEVKKELVERYKMGGKEKHDVENGWPPHA